MLYSDLILVFKWWFVFLVLGIIFLPLTYKIFTSFIDKGYLFSKILGATIVSYLIFMLGSFHILKFNFINIIIVIAISLIANLLLLKVANLKIRLSKIFLIEELIFLFAIFFWSYIRSFNPQIHDLEKYMDFGFINSILRTDYFPPKDMWFTPGSINYYYFGHLVTAVISKLSDVPSFISFNLMLGTIFAFSFSLSFSIGINLISKIRVFSLKKTFLFGFIFSYLVSFSGNLQVIYSLFKPGENSEYAIPFWKLIFSPETFPNSYWYPNATRFIYHTIHEFPSYSFVVADLHGHVLSIPIVLTLIAISFALILEKKIQLYLLIIASFLISVAYMTNAWDGLIYSGLIVCILLFLTIKNNIDKNLFRKTSSIILSWLGYLSFVLILFLLFSFVFNKNFSPFASGVGLICSPDILVKMGSIGPFIFEEGQCERSPIWQLLTLYGFFLFMIFSFLIFIRKRVINIVDYFILIISVFSFLLILFPEFFYLKDIYSTYFRANTMFKLAYQAFIMLSISSSYILIRIISVIKKSAKNKLYKFTYFIFILVVFIFLFTVSIYPYFSIPSGYGDLKTIKDLNGLSYLKESMPNDYYAISWINKKIYGQPVILEAQGDSYTDFGRVSANTGLPTVLGWTVHEWLWRGSYEIPSSRFEDIKNLYESRDIKLTKKLIKKYNISYVYLGDLEREKYNIFEDKFDKLGIIIYNRNNTRIYKLD